MTQTLHDYAQAALAADDYKKAAVLELLGMNPLLASLNLLSIVGNGYTYADHINDEGLQQQKVEHLRIVGGDVDVAWDNVAKRAYEEAGKIKWLGNHLARSFVCGDSVKDPRHPIGLYHRVPHHHRFKTGFDNLNAVISEVRDANTIITTQALADKIPRITYRFDRYGRRHAFYGDRIVIALTPAEAGEPDVEGDWLVVARFGDDGVLGFQNGEPEVLELGLVKAQPRDDEPTIYRTRLEWLLSPGVFAANALARMELPQ